MDESPEDRMLCAIQENQYEVVIELLAKRSVDPNYAHVRLGSMSLLASAVRFGHVDICMALLDAGADPSFGGRSAKSPLYIAAHDGKLAILKELVVRGADLNVRYLTGNTPLLQAVHENQPAMVPYLMEAGADPCVANNAGETGLHLAAITGNVDHMKLFLNAGVSVNASKGLNLIPKKRFHGILGSNSIHRPQSPSDSVLGNTPLHLAAYCASDRHLPAVKLLIDRGALVNAQLPDGRTPLHLAATRDAVDIARLLLSRGCHVEPVSRENCEHRTPLLTAVFAGHLTMVRTLIDAGADINFRDIRGCTPLLSAVFGGKGAIVLDLIRAGCDVNIPSENGFTPLKASLRHKPYMIQMLVLAGCTLGPEVRLLVDSPIDNQLLHHAHHDVREWLLNMISAPKFLHQLCREAIRKQVIASKRFLDFGQLPIPLRVAEYLNLKDAEEIFNCHKGGGAVN